MTTQLYTTKMSRSRRNKIIYAKKYLKTHFPDLYTTAILDNVKLSPDEEIRLLLEYQNGKTEHFDLLFRSHHLLILTLASILHRSGTRFVLHPTFHSILSETYDVYYNCLRNYKPNAKFSTYLYVSMRHQTNDSVSHRYDYRKLKSQSVEKQIYLAKCENYKQSIHDILPDKAIKLYWQHKRVVDTCMIHDNINIEYNTIKLSDDSNYILSVAESYISTISKRDIAIFTRRLDGATHREISSEFGLSIQRIDQIVVKIINNIRDLLGYEPLKRRKTT